MALKVRQTVRQLNITAASTEVADFLPRVERIVHHSSSPANPSTCPFKDHRESPSR